MSGSDKRKSSSRSGGVGGGGGGGGGGGTGGDDEDDGIDGLANRTRPEEERGDNREREGKGVSLFRFSSAKKKLLLLQKRRRRRKVSLVNSSHSGRRGGGMVGCCLCIKQPMTLDSSAESPTSDPNSKEFTYDMLKAFIEKNDFGDRECNPHLDDQ